MSKCGSGCGCDSEQSEQLSDQSVGVRGREISITFLVIRSKMECSADNALGIKITAILQ